MNFSTKQGVALILVGLFSSIASAEEQSYQYYIGGGVQQSWLNEPIDIDKAGAVLAGGMVLSPQWRVEFSAEQLSNNARGDLGLPVTAPVTELDVRAISLSVLGFSNFSGPTQLFYRLGVSQTSIDYLRPEITNTQVLPNNKVVHTIEYRDVSQDQTQLQFGLGIEHDFSSRWFGRVEWVHLLKKDDFDSHSARFTVGYRF